MSEIDVESLNTIAPGIVQFQEGKVNLDFEKVIERPKRIIISLDPSTGGDRSALCVIFQMERHTIPLFGEKTVEEWYEIVASKELKGSLVDQAEEIIKIYEKFRGEDYYNAMQHPRYMIVLDKTGLGVGIWDILRTYSKIYGIVTGVTITAGFSITGERRDLRVPRTILIENLQLLIQQGKLKIRNIQHKDLLLKELESFRSVYDQAGRLKFEVGISRAESHADFSFAIACGVTASEESHDAIAIQRFL